MSQKPMKKRLIRQLLRTWRSTTEGKKNPSKSVIPGPVRRLVGRVITAVVPKNASGNNASVR
jgi:hypothetical protein